MKKPKKNRKYASDENLFNTFKSLKNHIWYNTPNNTIKYGYELEEDVITKKYIFHKKERRLLCEKIYDKDIEELEKWKYKQLNLF